MIPLWLGTVMFTSGLLGGWFAVELVRHGVRYRTCSNCSARVGRRAFREHEKGCLT